MKKITIMRLAGLRRGATDRGASTAAVSREALHETGRDHRTHPRSLGIGASGRSDIAQRTTTERPIPRAWR